jgi:hypothetical protein
MRNVRLWSAAPARNVETASTSTVNVLRGLVARATTPLLPDDYLKLLNPLWSARELRGLVVDVRRETEDSATVTIKPGWGFSGDYQPGQYLRHRTAGWRPLALAVLLADVNPTARQEVDLDHRQGHSRGLLVITSGQRSRARHGCSARGPEGQFRST